MYVEEAARNAKNIRNAFATIASLLLTSYRYPLSANVSDGATYDYIIVGAGSAGSVIANRLTEDPDVSVLLIEAGGDPPLTSNLPGLLGYNVKSPLDWSYESQTDRKAFQCLQDNRMHIGLGKVLGGGSSINYMYYVRGDPNDYNRWAAITRDQSWNYTNVLKYFKKSERLQDPTILNSPYAKFHGTDGEMGVIKLNNNQTEMYLNALKELGYDLVLDTNGENTLGFSQGMMSLSDGIRQDTATAYLSNIKERSNLSVMKESFATKIIIDANKVARGVRVADKNNKVIIVKASKEVILSAGAFNSPQLLMLSGIGPRNKLRKLDIKVIADLPVGEKLQTHSVVMLTMSIQKTNGDNIPLNPHEYPSPVVNGFVALNASQSFPDYQLVITQTSAEGIVEFCTQLSNYKYDICQHIYEETLNKDAAIFFFYNADPKSKGHVSLKNSDAYVDPNIHMYPFPDENDVEKHVKYLEDFTRLVNTTSFRRMGAKIVTLPKCEGFGVGSKDYWRCYLGCFSSTSYHYASTCAMGSVVDSRLRVFGVKNLRVADASVMPVITSGNTNAPAIMIGEKAADMIKEDRN